MVAAYGPLARALCLALLTIGLLKGQAEPPAAEATPAESAIEVVIEAPESEDVDDAGVDAAGAQPLARDVRVTAYCDRGLTASGRRVGVGQCAAPPSIPFGSKVYIPALGRSFVVTDRTHPRFRHNTVDIFIPSENRCRDFGRHYLKCEFTVATRGRQG